MVERLVRAGAIVRVVSRRPGAALPGGVEVVRGDLAEPETLRPALRQVDRMYLFPAPATASDVVRLAERAGVRRIVTLSSGAVTTGHDTDFHLPVEQAVQASGLEWTHVRPGEFMLNNLWLWGPSIRAERVVREPFPDRAGRPVHERDIADVAAVALLEDGHQGKAYTLNGPELLSRRDQVRTIADAVGQDIRLEVVTPTEARDLYLAQGGFAAASAEFLSGLQAYSGPAAGSGPATDSAAVHRSEPGTLHDVIGAPARTFAAWAREHGPDFNAGRASGVAG
ncbi:NAD(P)H-binding protein [Dactylosporangium siamense]|uniref:Nucleotide-diphosphate-sugar epimerase n=1 Tax=Dactylosporangium siamense TaxID=685454 RepID=A0A919PPP4_9ACTN|nr:nucleotide-diphosphate-sugar epimerase [Dactylosporangium siamense]